MSFQWDKKKAASNEVKHGITFNEATQIYKDSNKKSKVDDRQDYGEVRDNTVGLTFMQKLLHVTSTERGKDTRIISARLANSREKKWYES